jgi:hypothetical protein
MTDTKSTQTKKDDGSSVKLTGGYSFDPEHFEIRYDKNGKPMRPNFDLIADQEKRIQAKQIYLDALNKYIADKKVQIAEFENRIRKNEEEKSKEEEKEELLKLDDMLAGI